ncbi:hypothetical protein MXD81_15740, partial [Microbacteriaceae bacterium K1510]|nr:hypothetical protein [Microbacteriaceae bacterium K1510]
MKQMQKLLSVGLTSCLIASLMGCNQAPPKQNAERIYEQVRTRFYSQGAFSFYGRTKLLAGQTANG